MTAAEVPCIRRVGHGFSEDVGFAEFADVVVQDQDIAADIAQRMLDSEHPYAWNPDEPAFYETFEVIDADALRAQLDGR